MSVESLAIQTGDVVVLNSGGPGMTVKSIRLTDAGRTILTVEWVDSGLIIEHDFDAAMLTKSKPL